MLTVTDWINLPRVRQHCFQWLWHKTGWPETETQAVGLHFKSHSQKKRRIFNPTHDSFELTLGPELFQPSQCRSVSAPLFTCSLCLSKLECKCPQGTIALSGLRKCRSWSLNMFTFKVWHTCEVCSSKIDLCYCPRNNCINAQVISGFIPASPELCWNICYLSINKDPQQYFA